MSQDLLILLSHSSLIWHTAHYWTISFPCKQQRKRQRKQEQAGIYWRPHSCGRAHSFSFLTFTLAPLQHHFLSMGFTLPNFKCLQWFFSSQPCSDELYLGRKPFSLFAVEPRAAQHSTGSRQDVSLLPSSAWEHFACTAIHGIKSGFHKTEPRGKSISLKGCTNHFGAAESIKTCYQCPVVWKLSSGMSCLMPDEN